MLPPNLASLPVPCIEFYVYFRNTGVNFTGHLWVKEGTMKRKMNLILFTCLNVRAVHIEVVPDMSVLSFFQALVQFTSLYGIPKALYNDNAMIILGNGRLFGHLSLLQ